MLTRGGPPGSYQRRSLSSAASMGSTIGFSKTGHRTSTSIMIGPKTDFWETPQHGSSQTLRKPYINLMDACDNPHIAVAGVPTQVTNDKGRNHSLGSGFGPLIPLAGH